MEMFEFAFEKWARTYFRFIVALSSFGVMIASIFVNPGDAALYLMTMNELSKI